MSADFMADSVLDDENLLLENLLIILRVLWLLTARFEVGLMGSKLMSGGVGVRPETNFDFRLEVTDGGYRRRQWFE